IKANATPEAKSFAVLAFRVIQLAGDLAPQWEGVHRVVEISEHFAQRTLDVVREVRRGWTTIPQDDLHRSTRLGGESRMDGLIGEHRDVVQHGHIVTTARCTRRGAHEGLLELIG